MVADAATYIERQPWLMVPPSAAIVLTVLALGLVGKFVGDTLARRLGIAVVERRDAGASRTSGEATSDSATTVLDDDVVLSVRHLSVAFPIEGSPVRVLQDVDLDIRRGETKALVGESGSGKTVTALSALGMIRSPGRVTSGACYFEGRDLLQMSAKSLSRIRGREIGFVGQDPMVSLDPNVPVRSLLAEAVRRHTSVSRRAARVRAIELLELVNLPDRGVGGAKSDVPALQEEWLSAWRSPWRSPATPNSSSPMNPRPPSTCRCRPRCWRSCNASNRRPACPSCS